MRGVALVFLLVALSSGAAQAGADQPLIGPAPSWVKPTARPAPTKNDGAPIRILLADGQANLEPGRQTVYADEAFQIQTPQGLAVGNLSLPWRPATDVLTVHKLRIRRGDQIIDVLKSGQTFTVLRREQNLESATLDGVLTANIQPEGLQVDDILEFAFSITSSDPTLKGHVEMIAGAWNGFPLSRAHLRIRWPAALPIRLRQTKTLPALKPVTVDGESAVELSLDNVEPITPPKGAPARYRLPRLIEVTDFASWADIAALMAPLYDKAAEIPAEGPLRTELNRIEALSSDPRVRAEAAVALVQDRVRYVALEMGAGGYVPVDAQTTWARRYGDCKGKTALLLALLRGMDIKAEPVLVSTTFGDGLEARLPMVAFFNHVIVRAVVGGRTYWLDGTRSGDTSLEGLRTPNFGWGLPLLASNAALVPLRPPPLTTPAEETTIRIDASAGIAARAPTSVETILRADDAITTNATLASSVGEARDKVLRAFWKSQYDFVEVKTASATFDAKKGELRLVMQGDAKLDWAGDEYETDGTSVGYKADFSRDEGQDKDAPFAVTYPTFSLTRETIILPKGAGDFRPSTGTEVDQTVGGIEYKRHATIAGGVYTIERSERSVVAEFPAKDAPAAQEALRALNNHAAKINSPSGYTYTKKDIEAAQADVPSTSSGYVDRARIFDDQGMHKEAIDDYGKAIELDPTNAHAWANRGRARVKTNDLVGAKTDVAKAQAIDPSYPQSFLVLGMIAEQERRPKDAVEAYSKVIAQKPENTTYAIARRAIAYEAMGEMQKAFDDAAAAIKNDPSWVDLYSVEGRVLLARGQPEEAIARMQAAIAVNPGRASAHVAAARIYVAAGRREEAFEEFSQAIALDPQAYVYAERSLTHPPDDKAGRRGDVEAAVKLDPKSPSTLIALADEQQSEGDNKGQIDTLTRLVAAAPDNTYALTQRARAHKQAGQNDLALADSAEALKKNPRLAELYLLRANIFLQQGKQAEAIKEAEAAEAEDPNEGYAHVIAANIYSGLHRDAEAMRAYDRAIALKPEAYIYVNRSVRRPKADLSGRRSDIEIALKLDPSLPEAIDAKAKLQVEAGDLAGAVGTYSTALERTDDKAAVLADRGLIYARLGDTAHAERDFSAARSMATEAVALNSLCWDKAVAGLALEAALADCNAALAKAPGLPEYLDSRGLVFLRLLRFDEAIADYDRALSLNANLPTSLYGRAIARARKGDHARSQTDVAAALKIDPAVGARFEGYGLKL